MKKGNSNLEKSVDKHAHHIVAAKDRRGEPSRRIMFGHGIGINDRCNGVYLFKAGHSQMHTNFYYANVNLQMEEIKSKGAKIVRNLLTRIGAELKKDGIQASKI
jgi:hypothetical protein